MAESKGEKIEYKNINKALGKFAEVALQNYQDSKKEVSQISKEKWIDEQFDYFVEKIAEDLNNEKYFKLTDNVNIVDLEEDAFLYIGANWKGYEHRMLFKDIKKAYFDGNSIRKDLSQNMNISGSARQHATYYVLILQAFLKFIKDKTIPEIDTLKVVEKPYILIIDEINRANLSSVLGELIYALEYRGKTVDSMYAVEDSTLQNKNQIILPPNLYIIGTMNKADRSVGHIDYAIRRRFAFVDVLPKKLADEKIIFKDDIFKIVSELFIKNYDQYISDEMVDLIPADTLFSDFKPQDVWLGHSYFIQKKDKNDKGEEILIPEKFSTRIQYEIIPILEEYIKDGILKESAREVIKTLKANAESA
ncbi:AAA family ATPase [Chryseobacterium mulctrae]|uniref:AAA family ATPase n=1 Tax=Chryseobacterium mulctrae TaxID=2576777 RepID=UPI001116E003|nr:AAA family ATPase [Chryseobacterium mulctrae]